MTLTIELSPQISARLDALAMERGLDPQTIVANLVEANLPRLDVEQPAARLASRSLDPENEASIALLQSWMDEDSTDDAEEIRDAEEELAEFKRNMNEPRKQAGARLIYPEAE